MMNNKATLKVAAGLALAMVATSGRAQDTGLYFGVTGGQAQPDLDKGDIDSSLIYSLLSGAQVISSSSDLDDTDTSLSLVTGYRFSKHLALEAGYVDLGTAEYRGSYMVDPLGTPPLQQVTYAIDFEEKGFTAAAMGAFPFGNRFDLHVQLGVVFADTKITARAFTSSVSRRDHFSASSQDFFYAIGAGLNLGANWRLSLDWQQFKDVGRAGTIGESDIDRLSLGVIFKL